MKLSDFEIVRSIFERARGIMFRRRFEKPLLFIFPRVSRLGSAIHSFFVFVEFDAVFLDEEKKVVDIRQSIKPFTPVIIPRAPAKFLIEAPAGWVAKSGLKTGEIIEFFV